MNLNDYFSDNNIIRQICKRRIKLAKKRHDKSFIPRLAGIPEPTPRPHELDCMLPPRAQWCAYRPRYRQTTQDPNLKALIFATLRLRATNPSLPWVIQLNQFILEVHDKGLSRPAPHFAQPTIFWELKKDHTYRPLSQFNLVDGIIFSLFAKYLTDFFDPAFRPCSYAFRSNPGNGATPTRDTAINALFELRRSTTSDLYVAECDIQGFYDCVEHRIAAQVFDKTAEVIRGKHPDRILNPRARLLFQSFLNCYSFPETVLGEGLQNLKEYDPVGEFAWPVAALQAMWGRDPRQLRIGVPQGGAVSGVIANLVLNQADEAVGAGLHYFRFCDDTLFVANTRKQCQKGLDAYLETLAKLKLPYHQPLKTRFYDKTFWDQKSKAPYCWTGRRWFGCVPWVQFIGYQVRYDGLMRVREKSVEKQKKRLREVTDEAVRGLLDLNRRGVAIQRTWDKAVWSVYHRLTSTGVGRVRRGQPSIPMPKCWTAGFKVLHGKPIATRPMQLLDYERERLARTFKWAGLAYRIEPQSAGWPPNHTKAFEYTSSYYAQFDNQGGDHLIRNPYQPNWWERLLERFYLFCRNLKDSRTFGIR